MFGQNAENKGNQAAAGNAQQNAFAQNEAARKAAMQSFMRFLTGQQGGQPLNLIQGGGQTFGGGVTTGGAVPMQGGMPPTMPGSPQTQMPTAGGPQMSAPHQVMPAPQMPGTQMPTAGGLPGNLQSLILRMGQQGGGMRGPQM